MRHISGVATAGQLLGLIIETPLLTRAQLLDLTGISRTTLLGRLDALISLDLLVEEVAGGTGRPGRPAGRLRVKDVERTVLVAALGHTQAQLAVTDAAGTVLATTSYDHAITDGPGPVLGQAVDRLQELLTSSGRDPSTLCGVGLTVPGPVCSVDGRVESSIWLTGWNGMDLRSTLTARWPVPVLVDNDANVMALGEVTTHHPDAHTTLLVKAGFGVGAGLVVDGELHHARSSLEGELDHVRVPGADELCLCGRTGCLATVATGRVLVDRLREQGVDVTTPRDVTALARSGDAAARELLQRAGRSLGGVLAGAVAVLGPERLLVGGDLAASDELFTDAVREGLRENLHPPVLSTVQVATASTDGRGAIAGAVRLVRRAVFSVEAVDAALSA
ncbi:ROK family protein [Auraticoccus monumenti]|uniref:Sugar kinase of the NBD/HSP70 family, may contain an N-terminal HTH domain n=1 Tax=Auraticoccus monumenti TaxID=675864 RepID=A0A1G6WMN0_9ACTN|nr:ROK family protein [Auraticoccus monumenti]SDD66295.1 Sugar kinase of the NBD/HSP70 family, may contain an N-terminal HTH domain [Auraticoccus monumenti]